VLVFTLFGSEAATEVIAIFLFLLCAYLSLQNDGVIFIPFRSNDHSDTSVLLSFKICEGSLVCVLPFLAKCSFRSDSIV